MHPSTQNGQHIKLLNYSHYLLLKISLFNEHGKKFVTFWDFPKCLFQKNLNISTTNDISRSNISSIVHLCKSFEYGTLIFENNGISEVITKKYTGLLYETHRAYQCMPFFLFCFDFFFLLSFLLSTGTWLSFSNKSWRKYSNFVRLLRLPRKTIFKKYFLFFFFYYIGAPRTKCTYF